MLTLTVTNPKGKKKPYKIFPGEAFSEPFTGRLTPECSEPWYLYGEGPFNWQSGSSPHAIDDARVFSLDCGRSYARSTGNCQTTNFGGVGDISAWAWTWHGDPALIRSFVRFNGFEFSGPSQLDEALLILYETGGRWGSSQFSGSNAFTLSRVTSGWEEYSVNWTSQPGAGAPAVNGPAGFGNVQIDVTPIVQLWFNNPITNHGFRLALQNERYYRIRSFKSSEGGSPPILKATISNPDAASDTLEIGFVEQGSTVALEYSSGGPVSGSITETVKEFDGENFAGKQLIYLVSGESCGNSAVSERLQAFAWVDSPPLTITIPEPKQAWPTIPSGGVNSNFNRKIVKSKKEHIEVTLAKTGLPLAGKQVRIFADWVPRSGAHDHDGSKKEAPGPKDMGWLIDVAENDSSRGRITSATDEEGFIRLSYRTPEFGGKVVLRAVANVDGEQMVARDTLIVQVPDLKPLPNGVTYAKVGGTDNHHGPRLDNKYKEYRKPDNNHYGTQTFVDSLVSIANAWRNLVEKDTTMDNRQTPLNINDMSLPNGGLFDITGKWKPSHDYHRVGRDADIRTTRSFPMIIPERNGILLEPRLGPDGKPRKNNKDKIIYENIIFEELCIEKDAFPDPEIHDLGHKTNEHYHIYFY